jgi:Subtilase family
MSTRTRHRATLGTAAVAAVLAMLCSQAIAAQTISPLPPSAYTVRPACAPPSPGRASCLALALLARTAQARAHTRPLGIARTAGLGPARGTESGAHPDRPGARRSFSPAQENDFGLRPQDLHAAYLLPANSESSSKQTIALVDAYNDPSAEEDLASYSSEFGLPACTTTNGCFKQVGQNGNSSSLPFPATKASLTAAEALCKGHEEPETPQKQEEREEACFLVEEAQGWSVEISLDIETAHAICQNCDITLVEAETPSFADLNAAEESAARLGATEISNSWGGPECLGGVCAEDSAAFNHPGVVITAAAGDNGYLNWLEEGGARFADFPAASPQVVAVGGTRLSLNAQSERVGETVWNDGGESAGHRDGHGAGGGGCSTNFAAQSWQRHVANWASVGCKEGRAVADVAADADPYTGIAVYDSSPACESPYTEVVGGKEVEFTAHWCTIGGTSLASPLIAAVFALAGGAQGVSYPAQTLYANTAKLPGSLHDVTAGSNGECLTPFNEGTGQPSCTSAEEAKNSCSSELICGAASGYDGPTGLGTPKGLAAFQPPAGGLGEEPTSPEAGGGAGSGAGGSPSGSPATTLPAVPNNPLGTPGAGASGAQAVNLSGLALTVRALIALNTSRPRIPNLSFTFTSNVAVRVRVSLTKRVGRHGHKRWKLVGHSFTISAVSGHNIRRLSGRGVLSPGTYRLMLTPAHGAARSILFKIG